MESTETFCIEPHSPLRARTVDPGRSSSRYGDSRRVRGRSSSLCAASLRFVQYFSHHPEIAQRKQRSDLSGVLRQPPVSRLHIAELSLKDAERMLDLRPNAGLQSFNLVVYRIDRIIQVQLPSLAGPASRRAIESSPHAHVFRCLGNRRRHKHLSPLRATMYVPC